MVSRQRSDQERVRRQATGLRQSEKYVYVFASEYKTERERKRHVEEKGRCMTGGGEECEEKCRA